MLYYRASGQGHTPTQLGAENIILIYKHLELTKLYQTTNHPDVLQFQQDLI